MVLYCYKLSYNTMVTEVAELLQYRLARQSNRASSQVLKPSAGFCTTGAVWLCIVSTWYSPFLLSWCSLPFSFVLITLRKIIFPYLPTFNLTRFFSLSLQQLRFLQHQMAMAAAAAQTAQLHRHRHTGSQSKSKMKRGTSTTPKFWVLNSFPF